MTLFEEIVAGILTEDVQIGKINDAINRTYEVEINYTSKDGNTSGKRIIQPVAYGLSKKGLPVIRAFQPFGDTQTSVPSWKEFLISGIQNWKPLFKNTFRTPPEGFNPNGDNGMSVVYNIATFWKTHQKDVAKNPKPIKASGPVKKDDIGKVQHMSVSDNPEVKKLEKLRKQLDNPKYISDIIKNNEFGTEKETETQDNSHMMANSGPVTKDTFSTQTEKDIANRYKQLEKNEKVSPDVLNQWQIEQEKRKNRKNGSYKNGIK